MQCYRCGGQMLEATDEHGDDDTHCIQCGARRPPTAYVRAAVLADLATDNRMRSARRYKKGTTDAA